MSEQAKEKELSPRWTPQVLRRCTPREILIIAAEYGLESIAKRMGYTDVQKFIQERASQ